VAPLKGILLKCQRVKAFFDLQRSGRIVIFRIHEKTGFKQVLERSDGVLGFS